MRLSILSTRSFRTKVAGAALVTAFTALVVVLAVFSFRQWTSERGQLIEDRMVSAQVMAANLAAPLLFRDPKSARDTLASAQAIPDFASVHLFDAEGRVVAELRAKGASRPRPRP
ncbi:MAG: Histidine kinase, partial [Phenylobacterium sp.]|nr:Histidine kinase [Phenylobacterium sp.]